MEETNKDEKGCCAKGKCCGCKALAAIALVALGAVSGYFGGRCCAAREYAARAASAPVNPAK